jgi:hypothetical protein
MYVHMHYICAVYASFTFLLYLSVDIKEFEEIVVEKR